LEGEARKEARTRSGCGVELLGSRDLSEDLRGNMLSLVGEGYLCSLVGGHGGRIHYHHSNPDPSLRPATLEIMDDLPGGRVPDVYCGDACGSCGGIPAVRRLRLGSF
jgi:hypothetical protein